ncbi:MAG: amidohydrolase family protein [Candidatus Hodarchaeota archaeon]
MTFDIIIQNGKIIDGTGNPCYQGELGIKDEKIVEIKTKLEGNAENVIDATDMIICPGFIDMHSHTDYILLIFNKLTSFIRQGITTFTIGQCGNSFAPIHPDRVEEFRRFYASTIPLYKDYNFDWNSFKEYIKKLESNRYPANIVPVLGFENIRIAGGPGYENRPPLEEEYRKMEEYIKEAMEAGAFGMSTGLIYAPQIYAKTEEITRCVKEVAKYNGLYFSHIRDEGNNVLEAIKEVIKIVRESGCRGGHIAHHKISGKSNWGKSVETLQLIEEINSQGISITYDQYPYNRGMTTLVTLLPPWVHEGGMDSLLEKVKKRENQERIKEDIKGRIPEWENSLKENGFKLVYIMMVSSEKWKDIEGKSISEITKIKGKKDDWETFFEILIDDHAGSMITIESQNEEDIRRIMKGRFYMVGTDGLGVPSKPTLGKYHPRFYGTFPRILGKYVREEKLLVIEDAIRRMTSFPAQRLGLKDRGLIREGMYADIVIFNPETVIDKSTYEDPHHFPEGIPYVIVNGIIVVNKNKQKNRYPGKILRRPS